MDHSVSIHQLPNGLRYVLVPMPAIKSVTVLALVHAGSRFETQTSNGISHFLEHMVFKGTKTMPDKYAIADRVESVGGIFNAYTSKEYTGFYVKTAVSHMATAMEVVSQLVFHPLLPGNELEIERGVILEEIKMREDEPQEKIEEIFENLMFGNTSLGWDVIGTNQTIREMKLKTFADYIKYMYTPNRITVIVAGGIDDTKTIKDQIGNYFGISKQESQVPLVSYEFKQKTSKKLIEHKKTEQCHLAYGFRAYPRGHVKRYVISVLSTILGGGMSSRLFAEIREKRGLAYYVGCGLESYHEAGYLVARAGTSVTSAQQVIDLMAIEFKKLKDKKVPTKELNKAKETIKGHLLLALENSFSVAELYGKDLLLESKIRSIDELLAGIDAVTTTDIQEVAQELLVSKGENLAAIGPIKDLAAGI